MKKIIILIHSLQAGGMERVVSELSSSFVKKGIEVHIVLYGIKQDIFYKLDSEVSIHRPNFIFNERKRFVSTLKTIYFLRKIIINLEPKTILSFGEYWNNLVLLATYGLKFPIYIADRSTPLKNLGFIQNSLRKWLYPRASGLILQTQVAKKIYRQKFERLNIEVIGNPIKKIKNIKEIKKEKIVLMVGRLIKTKHQDRLIRIFHKINLKEWKLIFVGCDAQKQKNMQGLEKLINRLKIADRVILVGEQKNVDKYYLKSEIFAFTSSSEGFPNVIGEAMSAGLPVVAYDCIAGPSEIIKNNKNGFLIPLFDDSLFQDRLELLMKNEELRNAMGKKAKTHMQKFDSVIIANKFLDVLFKNIT